MEKISHNLPILSYNNGVNSILKQHYFFQENFLIFLSYRTEIILWMFHKYLVKMQIRIRLQEGFHPIIYLKINRKICSQIPTYIIITCQTFDFFFRTFLFYTMITSYYLIRQVRKKVITLKSGLISLICLFTKVEVTVRYTRPITALIFCHSYFLSKYISMYALSRPIDYLTFKFHFLTFKTRKLCLLVINIDRYKVCKTQSLILGPTQQYGLLQMTKKEGSYLSLCIEG